MLGVSQYLTSNALDQTLGFVLAMPALSEIVFTIVPSDETFRAEDSAWVSALTKRLAEIGEPWLTRAMVGHHILWSEYTGSSLRLLSWTL